MRIVGVQWKKKRKMIFFFLFSPRNPSSDGESISVRDYQETLYIVNSANDVTKFLRLNDLFLLPSRFYVQIAMQILFKNNTVTRKRVASVLQSSMLIMNETLTM